jgi:hypothetical protein
VYTPALNQPFYIGDGLASNNVFVTDSDAYVPPGAIQTFVIPPGAKQLLLGIGADIQLSDNKSAANTNSAFRVHVYDDSLRPTAPVLSAAWLNPNLRVSFQTVSNQTYTILQNTNLTTTNWVSCTNFLGDGSIFNFVTPVAGQPCNFYRVQTP